MSTIAALVLCTAKRLKYLDQCLNYLHIENYFDQKILSIDEFGGFKFPQELKEKYENRGWELVIDNHQSKLGSLINSVKRVNCDYVFYQEDDIIVDLPDKNFILNQLNTRFKDRDCGWISLNLGGAKTDLRNRVYADLLDCELNTITSNEKQFIFMREESARNDWFFEFPSIFINNKLFESKLLILEQLRLYDNYSVEQNLTKAWFDTKSDTKYYKCCLSKNNLKQVLLDEPHRMMELCSVITLLDQNQVG